MKLIARGQIRLRTTWSVQPAKLAKGFGEIGVPAGSGTARLMPILSRGSSMEPVVADVDLQVAGVARRSPLAWLSAVAVPNSCRARDLHGQGGPVIAPACRTVAPSDGVVEVRIRVGNASGMVDLEERA